MRQTEVESMYFDGSYDDPFKEVARLRALAPHLPAAKAELAICYLQGSGVRKNRVRAHALFQEAAGGGSVVALFALGSMYLEGDVIPADPVQALRYWRRAARKDKTCKRRSADTCRNCAELIDFMGDKAASLAICNLAVVYETGMHGVRKSLAQARRWQALDRARRKRKTSPVAEQPAAENEDTVFGRAAEARADYETAALYYLRAIGRGDDEARARYVALRDNGRLQHVLLKWQGQRRADDYIAAGRLSSIADLGLLPPVTDETSSP
ncbi:tetratricopeptide repeat protein [Pseudoduganella umbonata]|uniref:Sel1 repeat family protein n=1 Tax=Pseudoduganella umbonata TaxID=864828 RepID=A0A4P8HXG6_9BURK|nr:tetratricopeptide repeat protein [Pseudoduganella umbonata]MBB3223997.1 TPR repeat protein [Pseudoduganella umbonata]QCP14126.1 sel1 repeat family protein [Pseudoduganella umbonata]